MSNAPSSPREPIAIIGSGCRFPGNVNSPSQLWELLQDPTDLRDNIPAERFTADTFYHPDPEFHGHYNVKKAYPLSEDVGYFDAGFFGVKPVEAASIDPQQRLLMEVVYEGLESAGLTIGDLAGSKTGLYVGMMYDDYQTMLYHDHQQIPTYTATGVARSIAANRISYFFDWRGPSILIDTACSSSLVAVHLAVQALRAGDCSVAFAAGTNLLLGPEVFIAESKLNMLSAHGQSRMWNEAADGYARGEGVATVVLKKLSKAVEDGDHIECIVREIDINQDGRTPGLTMPSSEAQTTLIREVYHKAGLDARRPRDRCQYFEAHGTGTQAGDPVEAKAIFDAFYGSEENENLTIQNDKLCVGSIKTVIGHTEGAAGLAGILKTSLALQNGMIPRNLLFGNVNPAITPYAKRLEIPTHNRAWPEIPPGQPRRASVNSFGFGGTNCHVILESAPPIAKSLMARNLSISFTPFVFSAQSNASLLRNLATYETYLENHPEIDPADLAWTLRSRRSLLQYRVSFAASPVHVLRANISKFLLQGKSEQNATIRAVTAVSPSMPVQHSRILGVFTGQGAQYHRMAAELIENVPYCAEIIDTLERSLLSLPLEDRPSWSLRDELLKDADSTQIHEASLSQPLCAAVQILLVITLQLAGIQFAAVVGHSSGEIVAAFAAGVLSARDAIRIAYYRGLYTSLAGGPKGKRGGMLAVGTSWEDAQKLCSWEEFAGKVVVAASNSSASVTLSGDEDCLEQIELILDDEKKFRRRLKVDKAYHSPHMLPCSSPYLRALQRCTIQPLPPRTNCLWFSSVKPGFEGSLVPGVEGPYWNENMVQPVRFMHAIQSALSGAGPFDLILEVGPHHTLKGPVMDTVQKALSKELPYSGILSRGMSALTALSETVQFLHSNLIEGELDYDKLEEYLSGKRMFSYIPNLPVHQWNHDRKYWHESPYLRRLFCKKHPGHPILGDISPESSPHQRRWRNLLRPAEIPWVLEHRLQDQPVFPAAGYIVAALDAAMAFAIDYERSVQIVEIENMTIHKALTFSSDNDPGVEIIFSIDEIYNDYSGGCISARFVGSSSFHDHETLQPMVSATIKIILGTPEISILPSPKGGLLRMNEVSTDQFYESLEKAGYHYSGCFRASTSLQRGLGLASGLVTVPKPGDYEIKNFSIHPAVLDMGIQTMLLAYSHPNDGRLRSLFVPTKIDTIRINPSSLQGVAKGHHELSVIATLEESHNQSTAILGDVDIIDPVSGHVAVQLQAVCAIPFAAPTSANDRQMFGTMRWICAVLDAGAATADISPSSDDCKLAEILERASCFYLRQSLQQSSGTDLGTVPSGLVTSYLKFAEFVTSLVAEGRHPYASLEWVDDRLEDILALTAPFSDTLDVQMTHLVGKNLPHFINGEVNMLEHLANDGRLDAYYTEALGPREAVSWTGNIVKQIVLQHPRLDILEIGAGTGSATKGILGLIDSQFSSYTFTDISPSLLFKAEETFRSYSDQMTYRVLDITRDVTEQGFEANSYDMVVASLVIHATASIENALRNVRSLLKPGGFLVLCEIMENIPVRAGFIFGTLPGWWEGADEGRVFGPAAPAAKWAHYLRKTGFSGIDSMTNHGYPLLYPPNVIVSQALDNWVDFLRHPLWPSPLLVDKGPLNMDLVILGGTTLHLGSLVVQISRILGPYCRKISEFEKLDDVAKGSISANATVLSLLDLDQPVFEKLSAAAFSGLKELFSTEKTILWVTHERGNRSPWSNMTAGFSRSVKWEVPELHVQFLDLEDACLIDPTLLATYLLRHHASRDRANAQQADRYLSFSERDIHLDQHMKEWVLRWEPVNEANDRFNSTRRPITSEAFPQAARVLVEKDQTNWVIRRDSTIDMMRSTTLPSTIVVQVSHSTLFAVRVGRVQQVLALGVSKEDEQQRIALTSSNGSIVRTVEGKAPAVSVSHGHEGAFVALVAANLLFMSFMRRLHRGQTLLLHDPPELLCLVAAQHSQHTGVHVVITTVKPDPGSPWIYLNPFLSRLRLRELLPRHVDLVVDATDPERAVASHLAVSVLIRSCLPAPCRHKRLGDIMTSQSDVFSSAQDDEAIKALKIGIELALQQLAIIPFRATEMMVPIHQLNRTWNDQSRDLFRVLDWTADTAVPIRLFPADTGLSFPSDKTYWFVGLSGSVGLSLCDWMIDHGARHIVISSRNPCVEDLWLEKARQRGVDVKVARNDITDETSLRVLYDEICQELPPLAGVIQGAMVLRDSPLREMTYDMMMEALAPKVHGSINLDRIFQDTTLDFFILMSSLTSIIGNAGQANYSAANQFLCSLARQRRQRGLNTAVINLGLIIGLGMTMTDLTFAQQASLTDRWFLPVSESDLHQVFAEAILACTSESPFDGNILTELPAVPSDSSSAFRPIWADDPAFGRLVTVNRNGITRQLREQSRRATISESLQKVRSMKQLIQLVTEAFFSHLRSVLDLDEDYTIHLSLRTDEIGVDSLIAVGIRSWFLKHFQANIAVLHILSGVNLSDLIDKACGDIPPELLPAMGSSELQAWQLEKTCSVATESTPEDPSCSGGEVDALLPSSPTSLSLPTPVEPANATISLDRSIKQDVPITNHDEVVAARPMRAGRASFSQSMFWFVDALMEEKTTTNHTLLYKISGNLRSGYLDCAVQMLSERHEILRTRFCVDKTTGCLLQEVLNESSLTLENYPASSIEEIHSVFRELTHHVYDLQSGKTVRIILLSIQSHKQFLLIGYHHIVTDGPSHFVMMRDLRTLYNQDAFDSGPPLQFLDYSEDEQKKATSKSWEIEIQYWKSVLTPLPEPLPIHRSSVSTRCPVHQHKVHLSEFEIGTNLNLQIRRLSRTYHATAFHVYLAAFKVILYQYLGVEDLCIGISNSNRWEESMQNSVGPYMNLLPIRLTARRDEAFHAAIQDCRSVSYKAMAHSNLPFEVLLNELRVARSATHSPIFQAFMDYRQEARRTESFGDFEMELVKWEVGKLPYDIFVDVNPSPSGEVTVQFMLQSYLYTQEDAIFLSQGYEDILKEMVATPTNAIGEEWIYRQEGIDRAVELGTGPICDSEWPATLLHQFEVVVAANCHKTAVKDGHGVTLSYLELMRKVDNIGNSLLKHGLQRQSHIAVYQEPSVDWLCSLLAIMKLGGVFVPLDVSMPVTRLALIVENIQPKAALFHNATAESFSHLGFHQTSLSINVSGIDGSSALAIPTCAAANRPAVILHTSGSTAIPKAVIINHSSLKNTIEHSIQLWGLSSNDVVLQQSASTFDLSLGQVFQALSVGATLCIASQSMRMDSRAIVDYIIRESVSLTLATPTEYKSWLQQGQDQQLTRSSWRIALTAGESVTEALLGPFRGLEKADLQLFNLYGPTETTLWSTQIKLNYHSTDAYPAGVPVGSVCPNEYIYILDEKFRPLPAGIFGEIFIGGQGVAAGYLNVDEQTGRSFEPDLIMPQSKRMYRTGDRGRWLPNGELLLSGRLDGDTEVKIHGIRIDLREIEQTILRAGQGALIDVAVSPRSSSSGTHHFLVAHVVLASTDRDTTNDTPLLASIRAHLPLPAVMCPSVIVPVYNLPRTTSAKLDRKALKSLAVPSQCFETRHSENIPNAALEMKSLWYSVIPNDISVHHQVHEGSDFFHVGGNSMMLIDLHARICEKYDVSISLFQLFQCSTLQAMTQLVHSVSITGEGQTNPHIDWDVETTPSPSLSVKFSIVPSHPVQSPPRIIILTGATGFLGQYLLRTLTAHPQVDKIICLAVRNLDRMGKELLQSPNKVEIVKGDLTQPNFGIAENALDHAFGQADAVIHNAADISQAKTYQSLRPANLLSTRSIVDFCAPRRIPIHYISTSAVSVLSTQEVFPEATVRTSIPPIDGSMGYIASKWASERYLERVYNDHSELPISIYRPSSIMRSADDHTSGADFTHDLITYSRRLRAIPDLNNIGGILDFVFVETVVAGILRVVFIDRDLAQGPAYHHLTGDSELPLDQLRELLTVEVGRAVENLPLPDWIAKAKDIGLSDGMIAVFEGLGQSVLRLPRLEASKALMQGNAVDHVVSR